MPFGQEPLLTIEAEEQLREELTQLWTEGVTAPKIAKKLGFGEPGPYVRLSTNHVYFYARHFGLKPRKKMTMKKNLEFENMPEWKRKLMVKWTPGMPQCVVENCLRHGVLYGYPSHLGKEQE
jgi:hypothetical protein